MTIKVKFMDGTEEIINSRLMRTSEGVLVIVVDHEVTRYIPLHRIKEWTTEW